MYNDIFHLCKTITLIKQAKALNRSLITMKLKLFFTNDKACFT